MACQACGHSNADSAYACASCNAPLVLAAWPDGVRCVAVISFDIDGPTGMLNRNPKVAQMQSTMSMGNYGPLVGAPRILHLLETYDVKASFYVPGWVAERYPKLVERIVADGHEVAHHGYLHEPPATLNREEEADVLDRGNAILKGITGSQPLGYRSPAWELSEHSLDLLTERGFLYDSSLMGHDLPYVVSDGDRALVELPVHWSLDDYPYFNFFPGDPSRLMASPDHVFNAWSTAFDDVRQRGGLFMLTMHPYVIGRPGRLSVLERLLRHIRAYSDVRLARSVDIATEFAKQAGID